MKKFIPKNKGFTMVEALVAISIFSMSILGVVALISDSVSDIGYAKRKIAASYLAEEGIEYIRNMRDAHTLYDSTSAENGWNMFKAKVAPCDITTNINKKCYFHDAGLFASGGMKMMSVSACGGDCPVLYKSPDGGYDYDVPGQAEGFIREITTKNLSADEVEVSSTVYWDNGSSTQDIKFTENLFNWMEQTAAVTPPSGSEYTLTVIKNGTGTGTVTSNPTGINCGTTCSKSFATNTSVTLTPAVGSGSTFGGWAGACSGTGTCNVTMDAAKSVTATFNTIPTSIAWTSTSIGGVWRSVAYGNGKFVAVAQSGNPRVLTSTDGTNWSGVTGVEANSWQSVTYGNGLFVAVALVGTNQVMTSPNGINWTPVSVPTNYWYSVTYGGGKYVAVGWNGAAMYSTDGSNWNLATTPQVNTYNSVVYGNGKFVAVSEDGTQRVMTSIDGINWTGVSVGPVASTWTTVTYGNGLFVAGSSNPSYPVMISSDGTNWTERQNYLAGLYGSTYGNGLYVLVGMNKIVHSSDGTNWTYSYNGIPWNGAASGNGMFVVVGSDTILKGVPQ